MGGSVYSISNFKTYLITTNLKKNKPNNKNIVDGFGNGIESKNKINNKTLTKIKIEDIGLV